MAISSTTCSPGDPSGSRGRLTLIVGCMFSGKTSELLRRLAAYSHEEVVVFKPRIDTRFGGDVIVSHGRRSFPASAVGGAGELRVGPWRQRRVVAIDEAHFFAPDVVDVLKEVRSHGLDLLVTALDRDSWGRPFPIVERLRAIAHSVREKTAFCARCGALAERTQRLSPITDRSMVGGAESYEPRCRDCWCPPPEEPP